MPILPSAGSLLRINYHKTRFSLCRNFKGPSSSTLRPAFALFSRLNLTKAKMPSHGSAWATRPKLIKLSTANGFPQRMATKVWQRHSATRDKPLFFDDNAKDLVDFKDKKTLGVYNGACTGKNNTKFSQSIYEANEQIAANQYPISGVPCFQPGAVPLKIQYADSWQKNGCSEGFLCESRCIDILSTKS